MSDDPAGYYARLEVDPMAAPAAVAAAFRRKAHVLHPDIVDTGDAEAFMRVKEAYDVLGDAQRRAAYDRAARDAAMPEQVAAKTDMPVARGPRASDLPVAVWAGLGGLFCLAAVMAVLQLTRAPPAPPPAVARPFAPSVPPLHAPQMSPMHAAVPSTGTSSHYTLPAGGPALLWLRDAARDTYLPGGQLAAFTSVQALRLVSQHGLVEVRLSDGGSGFVDAARLAPGDRSAARRAYCIYNAGPAPVNGEVLYRHGSGESHLRVDNHSSQPAVVKLRDASGAAAVSVFIAPAGTATVTGLPDTRYRPEFAIGELWSRACHGFSAGMRAQRFADYVTLPAPSAMVVPPTPSAAASDIPDTSFERE